MGPVCSGLDSRHKRPADARSAFRTLGLRQSSRSDAMPDGPVRFRVDRVLAVPATPAWQAIADHFGRNATVTLTRSRRSALDPETKVRPAGFEPATRCLEGTVEASRCVAWRRLMGRLSALTIAGDGLAWLGGWDCWLPTWLPDHAEIYVIRMSETSIGCATADGVALVRPDKLWRPRQGEGLAARART
jgi:hypothetical protein